MPQEQPLGPRQVVLAHVVGEGAKTLPHLPGDGFRTDVLLADPRMPPGEGPEGLVDEIALGLGVLELLQFLHALLVLEPFQLHARHRLGLELVQLFPQDDVGVLEDGFDEGDDVEGIVGRLRVQERKRVEKVERERLIHREIVGQLDVDPQVGAVLVARNDLQDLGSQERPEELPGAPPVPGLGLLRVVAAPDEVAHGPAGVAAPAQDVEQHAVRNLKLRRQALGPGADEAGVGLPIPGDEVPVGRLAGHVLLALPLLLLLELQVLDDVLGRLHHDPTAVVEPLAARAPGDLVELPRAQDAGLAAVELAEPREDHRANRNVDAHAEGVGAADDLQEVFLGKLLRQHPVLRQEPGVVKPDPVAQPTLEHGAVGARELERFHRRGQRGLLALGADVDACGVLRALRGFKLREVNDVDGALAFRHEGLERRRQRRLDVGILQRHRPIVRAHRHAGPPVQAGKLAFEEGGVAQRGGHEEEPRLLENQDGHLPGDAAVAVGVVVKLVGHDLVHVGGNTLAQGDIRENLRRAAKNRRVAVDGGIPGAQPHILGPELAAERHPLLVDERLDRAGIDRTPALSQRLEVERGGDQRLARAGRRVEDDVLPLEELQDGGLLRGVELDPDALGVFQKPFQQDLVRGLIRRGQKIEQRHGIRRPFPDGAAGADRPGLNRSTRRMVACVAGKAMQRGRGRRGLDKRGPEGACWPVARLSAARHASNRKSGFP